MVRFWSDVLIAGVHGFGLGLLDGFVCFARLCVCV